MNDIMGWQFAQCHNWIKSKQRTALLYSQIDIFTVQITILVCPDPKKKQKTTLHCHPFREKKMWAMKQSDDCFNVWKQLFKQSRCIKCYLWTTKKKDYLLTTFFLTIFRLMAIIGNLQASFLYPPAFWV